MDGKIQKELEGMDKRGKGRGMEKWEKRGEREKMNERKKEGTAKVRIREEKWKKRGRERMKNK